MKYNKLIFILIIGILFNLSLGFADSNNYQIVVNSQEWQDVYSSSIYSSLENTELNYLNSETDINDFIRILDKDVDILLIENSNNKIMPNFESFLISKGFIISNKIIGDNNYINNKLYELGNFENIVFVDDRSSYNLLSSIGFALSKDAYVIYLNEGFNNNYNLDENYIKNSYFVGSSITNTFSEVLDKYPNSGKVVYSDKYELNQQVILKINEEQKVDNVILTPGDILEKDILNGNSPVLLIGKNQVPNSVINFINDMDFESALIIETKDLQNAKLIREKTGIEVLVKISKATVYGNPSNDKALKRDKLEIFKIIPKESKLNIIDIIYNKATGEFILRIENRGESEAYFKSGLFIENLDGDVIATVGSDEILRLLPSESISQKIIFDENKFLNNEINIIGEIFYGESEVSIDKKVEKKMGLEFVSILDNSEIEIENVVYDFETKRFITSIKNVGEKASYVTVKFKDLLVDDELKDLVSKELKIQPNEIVEFKLKVYMNEISLADNEQINIYVKYGEKSGILIKDKLENHDYIVIKNSMFSGLIIGGDNSSILRLVLFIVVICVVVGFIYRKFKNRDIEEE